MAGEKVLTSFLAGELRAIRNDSVVPVPGGDCVGLCLHGNTIAVRGPGGDIAATLAGWPTVTTRDRLNALTYAIGKRGGFSQSKHLQYYDGAEIEPDSWVWLRASDSAIAAKRKGIRLPKGYVFEKSTYSERIESRDNAGRYIGYFETEKEAREAAKDYLAARRALADLVKAKEASAESSSYNEPREVSCKFGAPMGRGSSTGDSEAKHSLHVRGLHLDSGGYDNGGAYWGIGEPLFHVQGDEVEHYLRAKDREDAKAQALAMYPLATFTS